MSDGKPVVDCFAQLLPPGRNEHGWDILEIRYLAPQNILLVDWSECLLESDQEKPKIVRIEIKDFEAFYVTEEANLDHCWGDKERIGPHAWATKSSGLLQSFRSAYAKGNPENLSHIMIGNATLVELIIHPWTEVSLLGDVLEKAAS